MAGQFVVSPPALDAVGGSVVFEKPQWAAEFAHEFRGRVPRAIKIMHPCAGLNALERAAREMEFPWASSGDFEINAALVDVLRLLTNSPATLHCGPRTGNILNVELKDLDTQTDGLVSGPPCPPFSTIGSRLIDLYVRCLCVQVRV